MAQRPIATVGGGFPIYYKGALIGGLGISGGVRVQDEEVGNYALEGIER